MKAYSLLIIRWWFIFWAILYSDQKWIKCLQRQRLKNCGQNKSQLLSKTQCHTCLL